MRTYHDYHKPQRKDTTVNKEVKELGILLVDALEIIREEIEALSERLDQLEETK